MWLDRLLGSTTTRAVELTARFAEERQRVLAENIANLDTPGYRTKQLDPRAFQNTLHDALERAAGSEDHRLETGATGRLETGATGLELRGNAQVSTVAGVSDRRADGRLVVHPIERPAPNVLFHDDTNASLEALMADVTENALTYNTAATVLNNRSDTLERAIRGRSA